MRNISQKLKKLSTVFWNYFQEIQGLNYVFKYLWYNELLSLYC